MHHPSPSFCPQSFRGGSVQISSETAVGGETIEPSQGVHKPLTRASPVGVCISM